MREQEGLDVTVVLQELGMKIGSLEVENAVLKAELVALRGQQEEGESEVIEDGNEQ